MLKRSATPRQLASMGGWQASGDRWGVHLMRNPFERNRNSLFLNIFL